MDDLISRQAAIEAILKKPAWHNSDGSYYHSSDIKDALEGLPSAQPEIVRCKECFHRDEDGACDQYNDGTVAVSSYVPDEHFCSWGERRH